MIEPVIFTVEEAGAILKCSRRQIFNLIARGVLQAAPKFGRRSVVTAESVYQALEVPAASPPPPRRIRGSAKFAEEFTKAVAEGRRSKRR